MDEQEKQSKIKRSLKYSIVDGAFYSAMVGFGESFFSAFAVFLKATAIQLGLLTALPQLLGSLADIYSTKLLKVFKSRKRFVAMFGLFQGWIYIPIALVFFFGDLQVWHLIAFVCLYTITGMLINPIWHSWMGDLVDEKERGVYFSKRNRVIGFVSFITFLLGGYLLEQFSGNTLTQYIGFAALFGLALFMRLGSFIYLTKKYEPEYDVEHGLNLSIKNFFRDIKANNFGSLFYYLTWMNFSVYLAGPFFTAYMLYDLGFNYLVFAVVTGVSIISKYLFMPWWGKSSDKYGTRKMLTLAGFLMPAVPLLWMLSPNMTYLILIQIYAGFAWAGFELTSANFIFDATNTEQRATYVAYFNVFNGIAIFIGAGIGSLIVKYNHVFASSILLIFLMSFIARYAVSFIFLPKLKEVRTVQSISYKDLLLNIFTVRAVRGAVYSIMTFRKK
ncbi:MFS transporter [Candidatus Woesearchaeota archaeon]|nr:MAG: MFS transporter [Candidatus Woesearchaeota archaeon]